MLGSWIKKLKVPLYLFYSSVREVGQSCTKREHIPFKNY